MGAQPKNKITSAERGKRRAGNTPKLLKDGRASKTPLHKKTLFGKFLAVVKGAVTKPDTKANRKKGKGKANKAAAPVKATTATPVAPAKVTTPKATTPVADKKPAAKKAPAKKITK